MTPNNAPRIRGSNGSASSTPTHLAVSPAPALMSSRMLAQYLGFSLSTIWRMRAEGKLPKPMTVGKSLRWRGDEVVRWVEAGGPALDVWEAMQRA